MLTSAAPASEEDVRRFQERMAETEAALERERAKAAKLLITSRERQFAKDLQRMFREATWIDITGQFPDGEPLNRQDMRHVAIWEIFLGAINKVRYGAEENSEDFAARIEAEEEARIEAEELGEGNA